MTPIIQMTRIVSCCWASALPSVCSWSVIRTAAATRSSESFRREKPAARNARCMRNGGKHEEGIRLFPLAEEPLREAAQEAGDDSTRQRHARLLQEARRRSRNSIPDSHQHVFARLRCAAKGASTRMAAVEILTELGLTFVLRRRQSWFKSGARYEFLCS